MRVCNTDADTLSTTRPTTRSPPLPSPTRDALAAIGRAVDHVPYNVVVHTTPAVWYVEITPRLSLLAGIRTGDRCVREHDPARAGGRLSRGRPRVSITVKVCTTIDAPPDAVWSAVENIESHTTWMKDAVRITFKSEQHSGIGAEFECLTRDRAAVHHRPVRGHAVAPR